MTTALQVPDPATSTPGEFADAAVTAGMDEGRVDDLTDLFERVRYGDEPVSEAHERRAAETLRAIEADYEGVDATAASETAGAAVATDSEDATGNDSGDAAGSDPGDDEYGAEETPDGGEDA
ncbi:DUF4129 domain-containing protein [Halosimplex aquaticum]